MHPIINIATKAARNAGNIIVRHADRIDTLSISSKRNNDFVSEIDRKAEQEIISVLQKAYPDYGVLAEESGASGNPDEFQWVIDPLDRTTNYLHGFPQYAISIALKHRGILEHGVIYDPLRQELFTASRGAGAYLNDRRLRARAHKNLKGALLGTGFPFRDHQNLDSYLESFKALFALCADIRRAGSAALDLAWVAAGRLDGFWEMGLSEWDFAAGVLLIREAGGVVTDFNGDDDFMTSGNLVAANIKIHQLMLRTLQNQQT